MKKLLLLSIVTSFTALQAGAEDPITAHVNGDRINLRAKPETTAEVVAQVSDGDVLTVKSILGEWVEVVPPASVELWVHRDFIEGDTVTVNELNVRAGPGINYNIVGSLARGDHLTVNGTFGEWVKIAPFQQASLWVNKEYLRIKTPRKKEETIAAKPKPQPPAQTPTQTVVSAVNTNILLSVKTTPPPAATNNVVKLKPPSDLKLVPLEGQGKSVLREGELKPAPFLFRRPSAFRLVKREGNHMVTLCYVRGDSEELHEYLGERVRVRGREYWAQGTKQPILVIDEILSHTTP